MNDWPINPMKQLISGTFEPALGMFRKLVEFPAIIPYPCIQPQRGARYVPLRKDRHVAVRVSSQRRDALKRPGSRHSASTASMATTRRQHLTIADSIFPRFESQSNF